MSLINLSGFCPSPNFVFPSLFTFPISPSIPISQKSPLRVVIFFLSSDNFQLSGSNLFKLFVEVFIMYSYLVLSEL